jgi:hypothetical protein
VRNVCGPYSRAEEDTVLGKTAMPVGALAELRIAAVWFRHVCPSASNNSAPAGRKFMKFDTSIFGKSVDKIRVSLKSDRITGTALKGRLHFSSYLAEVVVG